MLVAAVPVCHIAAWHYDGLDHGSIVADEYVAFPLAVLGLKAARHPLVLALAFGVYRFFDALKPPPIHLAEYVTGGLGIVLDDVIAALVSWLVVALIVMPALAAENRLTPLLKYATHKKCRRS